jgi:tetratricopeptide (TPR) repeat protein
MIIRNHRRKALILKIKLKAGLLNVIFLNKFAQSTQNPDNYKHVPMRKLILFMILLFTISVVNSQSINTQSAYNALKEFNRAKTADEKQRQLTSAKKFIDDASVNAETMTDGKTWFYKGIIYLNLYRATGNADANLFETAIQAFKKANEFDTKKKFTEEIMVNVDTIRQKLYEVGVEYFKQNKFTESMQAFEKSAAVYDIISKVDTAVLLTACVAAERAGRYDKVKDYNLTVMKAGGNSAEIYINLGNAYTKLKDKTNAITTVTKGRELYPKNLELIKTETNLYLAFGEDEKAMQQLKFIAGTDSTNYSVFFAMGALYDKMYNDTTKTKEFRNQALDQALKSYEKALKINPNYFDAAFNKGILYNNIAAELLLKANNLPYDAEKENQALRKEADINLDLALPLLEKASSLNPNDMSTLIALKQIYVRKKDMDKAKMINDRINAIQKK